MSIHPYPYPHSVLIPAKHAWAELLDTALDRAKTDFSAYALRTLLLAPLGEDRAKQAADEIGESERRAWNSYRDGRDHATLVERVVEELMAALSAAYGADRRNLNPKTPSAAAAGVPALNAPISPSREPRVVEGPSTEVVGAGDVGGPAWGVGASHGPKSIEGTVG